MDDQTPIRASTDETPTRVPADEATITPYRDGPLIVRGDFRLTDTDGSVIETTMRTVALCRCGRSAAKPFCDGSHKAVGFKAPSGGTHNSRRPAHNGRPSRG